MKDRKTLQDKMEKIPLFELVSVAVEQDEEWQEQEKDFAVVEEGEDDSLNYVSDKYNLVQIREVFKNSLESIDEELRGNCYYHEGRGELEIYPNDKDIGIIVKNSVDGTSALQVDFATRIDNTSVAMPRDVLKKVSKVEPYKRIHSYSKAGIEAKDYLEMLSEVQDAWGAIVEELSDEMLDEEEMEELAEEIALGKKFQKKVKKITEDEEVDYISFWRFMLFAFKNIHEKDYKSSIHYREKVRNVADAIISECVLASL